MNRELCILIQLCIKSFVTVLIVQSFWSHLQSNNRVFWCFNIWRKKLIFPKYIIIGWFHIKQHNIFEIVNFLFGVIVVIHWILLKLYLFEKKKTFKYIASMSMGPSYTVWNVNCKSIKRSKTLIGNIKLDYYILCTLNLNISLLEVFLYILTLISHIQMFFIFYIHSLLFLYNDNHSILVLGSSTKHSLHFLYC